jgi:hypothetical protein
MEPTTKSGSLPVKIVNRVERIVKHDDMVSLHKHGKYISYVTTGPHKQVALRDSLPQGYRDPSLRCQYR